MPLDPEADGVGEGSRRSQAQRACAAGLDLVEEVERGREGCRDSRVK